MCSIFGCIGSNYLKVSESFVKELSHRGPDGNGVFLEHENKMVLGHNRLSIIDLSTLSSQPFYSEDRSFVIVFNGEIYNYKSIKEELFNKGIRFKTDSDTEVVLYAYITWGKDCLKYLRGMFAFAIYSKMTKTLFFARDRFGIKPLIYGNQNGNFYFSSELKVFIRSSFIKKKINQATLQNYLLFGSIIQPQTILEDFQYLMPGHYMVVKDNEIQEISKYYNFLEESAKYVQGSDIDYSDACLSLRNTLEEATRLHMVADVEVGAFLSGGIDSSAVVALMQKYSATPLKTFSLGFDRSEVVNEVAVARKTAEFIGTSHNEIIVNDNVVKNLFRPYLQSIDQPAADGFNTFIVSHFTSQNVKVAVSGLGGDEIFAGYPVYKVIMERSLRKKNIISKLSELINDFRPNRYTLYAYLDGVSPDEGIQMFRSAGKACKYTAHEELSNLTSFQKISYTEINGYLLNTLLNDADVFSMANSIELRPVLLDHILVEKVFALVDGFKIRGNQMKAVFLDSVKDLIPESVCKFPKSGFSLPLAAWMNGVLHPHILEVIERNNSEIPFHDDFLSKAKERKLNRSDWNLFVLYSWMDYNRID